MIFKQQAEKIRKTDGNIEPQLVFEYMHTLETSWQNHAR